jgi:tetratricopeptide (TPR) repeat protein
MNSAGWLAEAAATHRDAGQPDQAIAVYRELMSVDAGNASRWHWELARTLHQFGRWKEAITALRGTDRFPENNQLMAHANRQLKQFNEAVTLYRQIAAAHPPHASWALLEIAHTYEDAGQKDAAIKAFKAVCDRYPRSHEASRAHALLQDKYKVNVTLGGTKDE